MSVKSGVLTLALKAMSDALPTAARRLWMRTSVLELPNLARGPGVLEKTRGIAHISVVCPHQTSLPLLR